MKNKLAALLIAVLPLMFSGQVLAGDADCYFFPQNGIPEQTISGDLQQTENGLKLVPEDAKAADKALEQMAKKAASSFGPFVDATLTIKSAETAEDIRFVLVTYEGSQYFIATLADGQNLIWQRTAP